MDDLCSALDADLWESIISSQFGMEADVRIPSFETEFGTKSIKEILRSLGIERAFNSVEADFSEMTDESVCVGDVLHKAKIRVDEQGSEAAAVTDVVMLFGAAGPSAQMPAMTFEFHADHPFLYAITEVSTGAIIFMGQFTGKNP